MATSWKLVARFTVYRGFAIITNVLWFETVVHPALTTDIIDQHGPTERCLQIMAVDDDPHGDLNGEIHG